MLELMEERMPNNDNLFIIRCVWKGEKESEYLGLDYDIDGDPVFSGDSSLAELGQVGNHTTFTDIAVGEMLPLLREECTKIDVYPLAVGESLSQQEMDAIEKTYLDVFLDVHQKELLGIKRA